MMKIGDMVKFNEALTGLGNVLGIVIGFDGECVEVRWIDGLAERHRESATSSELPEFLDVVSRV